MEKQKSSFRLYYLMVFAMTTCLFLFFIFANNNNKTYASNQVFEIIALNYDSEQWATENVVVKAKAKPGYEVGNFFYSINNPSNFLPYENEVVVQNEGESFIYFKYEYKSSDEVPHEEYDSIKVKIDKTNPVVEKVELSQKEFTREPVSVKIFLADSSVYKELYKAEIFEEEFLPLPEFLEIGQIVFEFVTERNTVLNIGDIVIYDQAGNQTVYNKTVVIDNIDNVIPDFHLNLLNGKNQKQKLIEIKLGYIHSQAKEIVLVYPSGKQENLQVKDKQTISVEENGTFVVKVTSHTDAVFSRGIIVSGINKNVPIIVWFVFFVVSLTGVAVAIMVVSFNKKRYIKIINKNK